MYQVTKDALRALLDGVLDADEGNHLVFSLIRYSAGDVELRVKSATVEYHETRPWSEIAEAIARAKEATDE